MRETHDDEIFVNKPGKMNAVGALHLGCALIEYLVTRVSLDKGIKIDEARNVFETRRQFFRESPLFAAIVDVLEYDITKFRQRAIVRVDELEGKAILALRHRNPTLFDVQSRTHDSGVDKNGLFGPLSPPSYPPETFVK
jgi:hypothetical protein